MKLTIIGTGYVGLITGACFAEFGYETVCVDKDLDRINQLNDSICPFYEPGVEELLNKHLNKTKLLSFSNSLPQSVHNADIVFITVGTPSKRLEGDADLSFVWDVAREISQNIKKYCLVVTKSTVPVGTTQHVKQIILENVNQENFDVVSNPEFLREGSAIDDFMRPDRVVIGCENKKSENIMRELYRPLNLNETPIVSTSIESSEVIKYASNSFLATKISFINQVANLCERVGANIQDVAKGMGIDKRIGSKFLHAGPGYGGSCFPKDVKAFINTAKKNNLDFSILSAVDNFNDRRISEITKKIISKSNLSKGDSATILGLSFKPNTDDMREASSIPMINYFNKKNCKIRYFDPSGEKKEFKNLKNVKYFDNIKPACLNSDLIILHTEWNDFKLLNFRKLVNKKNFKVYDMRNMYSPTKMKKLNINYFGIGR